MKVQRLITEALALTADERLLLIEELLSNEQSEATELDEKWGILATKRLAEVQAGQVQAGLGVDVFNRIRNRLSHSNGPHCADS